MNAYEALNIHNSILNKYLLDEWKVPRDAVRRALEFSAKSGFESIVSVWGKLGAFGIVKKGSMIGYGLVPKILAIDAKDVYLENAILWLCARELQGGSQEDAGHKLRRDRVRVKRVLKGFCRSVGGVRRRET